MLNLDNKLRVGVGEALEFILVQIHDEEFIGWCQLNRHLGELLVEIPSVTSIFLKKKKKKRKSYECDHQTDHNVCNTGLIV